MKFLMETKNGRKGVKHFSDLNEYIDFMTKYGDKISKIVESDVPYNSKPVELPKVSSSNGWEQLDKKAFSDVLGKAEKGDSVMSGDGKESIVKDDAQFSSTKSSEKTDKQETPKIEKSPVKNEGGSDKSFKEFKYEDSKKEESKEEKNDKLTESSVLLKNNDRYSLNWNKGDEYTITDHKLGKIIYKSFNKQNAEKTFNRYSKKEKLSEGIKDYLPRAGFIRRNDEDKDSQKMGIWGGQGTDDQLRKAKIIAKVKFANGDRMGQVKKSDLENFDEYYKQYKEIFGAEELDEGWVDKAKKYAKGAIAGAAMAGALATNAHGTDNNYQNPNIETPLSWEEVVQQNKPITINGHKTSVESLKKTQQEYNLSNEDMNDLINGIDPYGEDVTSGNQYQESVEKPSMDDVSYEDDLTDADKEMYDGEIQHILEIWDTLTPAEQSELKRLLFSKSEKEPLNEEDEED